ncbi:neuronal acetylcholine receptor subunit alpha-10-like isoform X2 [Ptychodera flava]|uniref:neuronal acetylcholine receptor subunit alpha-10-like isoform X2 n=1 Tax=Ptychodera flava TaxID=63121 RepID=UPI00396AAEA2
MYLRRRVLPVFVLFYLCQGTALSYSDSNKTDNRKLLHRHLFDDYDAELLPVFDSDQSVNVTYGFSLNSIVDVDQQSQSVAYNIWFRESWIDERLTWKEAEYGGLKDIVVTARLLWRPDIRIYESFQNELSSLSGTTHVRIYSNGTVQWLYPNVVKVGCKMNVMQFPFDQQCCTIKVGSWVSDRSKVDIYPENAWGASLNYSIPNGVWDITSAPVKPMSGSYECCPGDTYPTLVYMIRMRRRHEAYVLRLILPTVSICLLSLFGFYLPAATYGRIGLAMTSLLTMFVFYQMVAAEIPPTNQMPYIGVYISINIVIMVFNALSTMAMLYFNHMGSRKPVPKWLDTFMQKYISVMMCQGKMSSSKKEDKSEKARNRTRLDRFNTTTRGVFRRDAFNATVREEGPYGDFMTEFGGTGNDYDAIDLSRPSETESRSKESEKPSLVSIVVDRYADEDVRAAISGQWQTFALVLDRIFFLIFGTMFVLTSLWYIIVSRASGEICDVPEIDAFQMM